MGPLRRLLSGCQVEEKNGGRGLKGGLEPVKARDSDDFCLGCLAVILGTAKPVKNKRLAASWRQPFVSSPVLVELRGVEPLTS